MRYTNAADPLQKLRLLLSMHECLRESVAVHSAFVDLVNRGDELLDVL